MKKKKSLFKPGTEVIASVNDGEEDTWIDNLVDDPNVSAIIEYRYSGATNDYYILTGVVLDKKSSKRNHVFVLWDQNDWDFEETEIDIEVLTLASERNLIEENFDEAVKEIESKMKEVAVLVNDAGKMARSAGARSLQSLYRVTRPLIDAMDNNGWRSSSWSC